MAGFIQRSFNYIPQYNGDEGLVEVHQEADSQTFVKGDLVHIDASGLLIGVTTSSADNILGIALKPATNVTANHTMIPVQVIRSTDRYSVHNVAAVTFTKAAVGSIGECARTSAGNWEVDTGTTTNAWCIIRGSLEGADGAGPYTAGGPVVVRFRLTEEATTGVLQGESDTAI